jgi:L-tartrate/succinate antiporter
MTEFAIYLPAEDYWRLGTIFGAVFLILFLMLGIPWAAPLGHSWE